MEPILSVENLWVSFARYGRGLSRRSLSALRGLSLAVEPGQVLAVVGESGAGKSLLAHAVFYLLPQNARVGGTLRYDGAPLTRERAEALVGAGYPYDYVDDAPACPQCQDSGCLADGAVCRCLMRYYTQEQNRRLSKLLDLGNQSFETFSLDWYGREVWPEYGRSPLENMKMIREICGDYARTFPRCRGNLLFTGAPGLGKTFLSACVAREVSARGFSVVYDTAGHVFQQFESGKFGRENPFEEDPDREVNRYLNCDLLIMDDVGTEMLTSFVQSAFYRIVNDRLVNRRKTVLSTNLPMEELERRYGEAASSRIRGEYQMLRFFGEDIRVLKRDR